MITIDELLAKKNYLNKDIDFLPSVYIYEFDIRAANINSLMTAELLSENIYYMLLNAPKMEREIFIGNMIKADNKYQKAIDEVIRESKRELITEFIKDPNTVLRIANDAIYFTNPLSSLPNQITLNSKPYIIFVQKNMFNNYLKFENILVFINTLGSDFVVDVKGISDESVQFHEPILELICTCISAKESGGRETAIRIFKDYYQKYVTRSLPIGYYREFNSIGGYRMESKFQEFISPFASPNADASCLNIDYNLKVLRILYSYLMR